MKEREIVELTEEEFNEMLSEESDIWAIVQEENVSFDSEKGFVEIVFVAERESDGKFFAGSYTKGGQGNNWIDDYSLEEVFKVTKTIETYE